MKLEKGQSVRLKKLKDKHNGYWQYGRIVKVYGNYIVLQFEKYKECILKADILNRDYHDFSVKNGDKFKEVNIDMWGE